MPKQKKTPAGFSLALGSGGARGLAHIGVLRVLEREGLRPRAVAGTSMGAYVGAMYAAGFTPAKMAAGAERLGLREIAQMTSLTLKPGSLLTMDRIEERLREQLPATFEELAIPFACVCADLAAGEAVVFTEGDLPKAVRTSMTIPIMFDAVRDGERLLVDGGVVDPVPVDLARELGGGPVLAVDVGRLQPSPHAAEAGHLGRGTRPMVDPEHAPNVVQVGTRTLDVMSHWLALPALTSADVVITPDVGGYSFADVLEAPEIIEEGALAAEAALPAIHEVLREAARSPFGRWWRSITGV